MNIDIEKVNEYYEIIFNGVLLNMENCENLIYVIYSLNTNNIGGNFLYCTFYIIFRWLLGKKLFSLGLLNNQA